MVVEDKLLLQVRPLGDQKISPAVGAPKHAANSDIKVSDEGSTISEPSHDQFFEWTKAIDEVNLSESSNKEKLVAKLQVTLTTLNGIDKSEIFSCPVGYYYWGRNFSLPD